LLEIVVGDRYATDAQPPKIGALQEPFELLQRGCIIRAMLNDDGRRLGKSIVTQNSSCPGGSNRSRGALQTDAES
jgi:hypothetical protein